MANRKKEKNPIVNERLNSLLSETNTSSRWLCRNVLIQDGIEYSSSNFSRFTTGKAQPPDWIIEKLANHFKVRFEWLKGLDDFRTESDLTQSNVASFFEQVGNFAMNPQKVSKLDRIVKLGAIGDTLTQIYGVPDGWNELPMEHGIKLIMYLDEQLEHAFHTYFKYVHPIEDTSEDDQAISKAFDGGRTILEDVLSCIKDTLPQGTTDAEFIESLDDERIETLSEIIEKHIKERMT